MNKNSSIFRQVVKWQDLKFYQKSEVLYHLTYAFCERFLPRHGDRTVDQMVQAARSCKQNIVEGYEGGKTSTETELRLLNVARASVGELRQDFVDYLKSRHLKQWEETDGRYEPMRNFTKSHNELKDYEPYFQRWTDEEMANVGITLCFQVDVMMNKYMAHLERGFVTQGGIRERMHEARTGYHQQQLAKAQAEAQHWKKAYEDLKQRALKAYNEQQEEIKKLKQQLGQL